jgi:tetratricopeptide (TPR) repeat protein
VRGLKDGSESTMKDNAPLPVTEAEIEVAEDLSAARDFTGSLRLSQELLERTGDAGIRMRLIFGIVLCASMLELNEIRDGALGELDRLPQPDELRALANINRAYAEKDLGRPANAIEILDANLQTGFFERADWKIHKYRCLFLKGSSLTALSRHNQALKCLDAAHTMYPDETSAGDESDLRIFRWTESSLQIDRANCLLALGRFEDCYLAAELVARNSGERDLVTLAMQYMAECRVWQCRVPEALNVYAKLKERLPCKWVDENRIHRGISNCMNYLEKQRPPSKPS